ncbi:MAG TPA: 4Fe-4S double cluster binding domain-containing protein [Dehalococcoidales bacterium]
MSEILDKISREMKRYGYKFKSVSISHLPEVQEAVAKLVRQGMISEKLHSNWHFYLDSNKDLPKVETIFIIAMPQSITCAQFEWQGKAYSADFPPGIFIRADESRAGEILSNILKTGGYKVVKAHLALKTLAVRSGLAKYGKNNISYVPGMGSSHRLIAFYTDYPCEEDNWHEIVAMKACNNCSLCRENCPAQSISADRFLIHAENCQTFDRAEKDSSWWVQPHWHNTLVGCVRCQQVCPANKPYLRKITVGPHFSESETKLILNGTPIDNLDMETRDKLDRLADEELYLRTARNLRVLLRD